MICRPLPLLALSLLACLCLVQGRAEAGTFEGPVSARVLEVLDGDTFLAEARLWPGQYLRVNVRLRGIDAPEMKGRCPAERSQARDARRLLAEILGPDVLISNIGGAKYYGRVLADVATREGGPVAARMMALGIVRAYRGGKRASWCR